jgi:DNA-binding response OmpR family regulator
VTGPESKLVLVVDDDQPINELVRLVLETRGYRVDSAADGEEAVEALGRRKPDLVVLDVMIPKLSGLDVCRFIKETERLRDVKVVMLSAKSLDVDKLKAKGLGADAYLTKPVKLSDLLDTVNGLLTPPSA